MLTELSGTSLCTHPHFAAGPDSVPQSQEVLHLPACNILKGEYRYTSQLLSLGAFPPDAMEQKGHGQLKQPRQHNHLREWAVVMKSHPDKRFANFIIEGLNSGFRIGFNHARTRLRSAKRNLPSASDHAELISAYLALERKEGRLVGPILPGTEGIQVSPIGLIPKPHQPGKWRLITDLSSPQGASVNDGIDPELCSLTYTSVDAGVRLVTALGRGALMAKLDLSSAYRRVPVHPKDQPLLGICWMNEIWLDTSLPFGLRSAPVIFSAVADALAWAMHLEGVTHQLHYLDDYFFTGPAVGSVCERNLQSALAVCDRLHFPVATSKTKGPTTRLVFLGIVIDSALQVLELPQDKLTRLQRMSQSWLRRKVCTKRELLSLLGYLHHAATVVRPGRIFTRNLIEASRTAKQLHHHILLNVKMRADLAWWAEFLPSWNGSYAFLPGTPSITVTSDASGTWGCGAFVGTQWFQAEWPVEWQDYNIACKEMAPILFAAATWGAGWSGHCVCFKSDNIAVVSVLQTGRARDPTLMHLLRCIHFYSATLQFNYTAAHIAGKLNSAADALSRNKLSQFFSLLPQADHSPSAIPHAVMTLAFQGRLDWTAPQWRKQFRDSLI